MMTEAAVLACEAARVAAINAGDWAAVAALLADDYVQVHGNGRLTDRAATLARLAAAPRRVTRGPLQVRLFADASLIVGEQVNADGLGTTCATVSQVLHRGADGWRFVSLHFTALRA